MSARTWAKADGQPSAKGNANTGPRRNIVIEFDIAKLDKAGKPTRWSPLIEKWEAAGITVKDAMSALIWHLKEKGPLVCVVDSAGKSLHAWFHCLGESEEARSQLRKFFAYAVKLGADSALWTISQFVRIPDGLRDGKRQTVIYFAAGTPRNGANNNEHFNEGIESMKNDNSRKGSRVNGEDEVWEEYRIACESIIGPERFKKWSDMSDEDFEVLLKENRAGVMITFLSPSQLRNYTAPEGSLLVGDNHITRGTVFVIGGAPGATTES